MRRRDCAFGGDFLGGTHTPLRFPPKKRYIFGGERTNLKACRRRRENRSYGLQTGRVFRRARASPCASPHPAPQSPSHPASPPAFAKSIRAARPPSCFARASLHTMTTAPSRKVTLLRRQNFNATAQPCLKWNLFDARPLFHLTQVRAVAFCT